MRNTYAEHDVIASHAPETTTKRKQCADVAQADVEHGMVTGNAAKL